MFKAFLWPILLPLNRLAKTPVDCSRQSKMCGGVDITKLMVSHRLDSLPSVKGAASALQIVRNGMCVCAGEIHMCVSKRRPRISLSSFLKILVDFFVDFSG